MRAALAVAFAALGSIHAKLQPEQRAHESAVSYEKHQSLLYNGRDSAVQRQQGLEPLLDKYMSKKSLLEARTLPPERSATASASAARIIVAVGAASDDPRSGRGIYALEPSSPAEANALAQGKPRHKIGEHGPGSRADMPGLPAISADECAYCFRVLESHLAAGSSEHPRHSIVHEYAGPHADTSCGVFVTWKRDKRLLGCIGTLSAVEPYGAHLADYALAAATEDGRFAPIDRLTDDTTVTVSRLGAWERVADPLADWDVGVHGLILRVYDIYTGRLLYSGTFLPEVAEEHGWSRERTLDELVSKAGVPSGHHAAVYGALVGSNASYRSELTRYATVRRTMSYAEYTKDRT